MVTTNTGGDALLLAQCALELGFANLRIAAKNGRLTEADLAEVASAYPPSGFGKEDTEHLKNHVQARIEELHALVCKHGS